MVLVMYLSDFNYLFSIQRTNTLKLQLMYLIINNIYNRYIIIYIISISISVADLYEENTGSYFPCRPGFPLCMQIPLDPPMLKEDEDVKTEADVDSPPVRRSSGSYLFRSRK